MSLTATITLTPEVQTAVNASLSTDDKKETAANKLSNNLASENVKKKAYDDVKKLAETIRGIRDGFSKVNVTLVSFDNEKFKDSDGKELQLGPEWKKMMTRFEETMQTSYENATSAVVVMKEMTSILGTDIQSSPPLTYADLQVEVDSFIEKAKEKETSALATKTSFKSLADDVRLFSGHIDVVLKKASEGLVAELAHVRQTIQDLTEKLDTISNEIILLAVGIAAAVAVGATAGIFALFTLSPVAAGIAAAAAISAASLTATMVVKIENKNGLEQEKKDAEALRDQIVARDKILTQYVKTLEDTKTQITEVASQIDAIANIWQTINLDMFSIRESLQKNVSKNAPITGFFWRKLAPTKETYRRLTECLETYVEQSQSV